MNYYHLLGLDNKATVADVKKAYRKMAKVYHPDVNKSEGAHQRFIDITEAYNILINPAISEEVKTGTESRQNKAVFTAYKQSAHRKKKQEQARYRKHQAEQIDYVKIEKEIAFLKKTNLFNLMLLRYLVLQGGVIIIGLFLIVLAIFLGITAFPIGVFLFSPIFLLGIWMVLLSFKQEQRNNDFVKFDFSHWNFNFLLERPKETTATKACFYTQNNTGDALPYKYLLFHPLEKPAKGAGSKYAKMSYNRKLRIIHIPRSEKAWMVHKLAFVIKLSAIITSILLFRSGVLFWDVVVGLLCGGMISSLLFIVARVKSNSWHLLTIPNMLRMCVLLAITYSNTWLLNTGELTVSNFPFFTLILLMSILELFFLIVNEHFNDTKFNHPFYNISPAERELFSQGYHTGHGLPVLTILYSAYKWLLP